MKSIVQMGNHFIIHWVEGINMDEKCNNGQCDYNLLLWRCSEIGTNYELHEMEYPMAYSYERNRSRDSFFIAFKKPLY